ncbi:MAG: hypothetical protein HC781_23145, partial [Leptolyngbyaceae cyanobacterium CSU_1_4]|nr:hypothetical protein [Leptolyngbyaceae cyanobacterium CSU_1_4]
DSLKNLIPPDTEDISWFNNPNLWVESKYIFGGKGSGKSMLMAYEAYVTLKAHPNAILIILDPHLSDDSEWFGGNALLSKSYCFKVSRTKALINIVTDKIDFFYAEFHDRIEKGDRNRPLLKLMIDEIEAAFKQLARVPCDDADFNTYEDKVHDLIESIQDEGRKFQVEVSLGSHTIKKGRSGVDSDTTQQMHWIACGDVLSAPNIKLPGNIAVEKLETSRQRIEDRCVPRKFARTAIVKVNSTARIKNGYIKAVGIPYLKLSDIRFVKEDERDREAEWITQNASKIDALWARGNQTLRKLSDELAINRERWQYQALTVYVNQLIKESKGKKEKTENGRTV